MKFEILHSILIVFLLFYFFRVYNIRNHVLKSFSVSFYNSCVCTQENNEPDESIEIRQVPVSVSKSKRAPLLSKTNSSTEDTKEYAAAKRRKVQEASAIEEEEKLEAGQKKATSSNAPITTSIHPSSTSTSSVKAILHETPESSNKPRTRAKKIADDSLDSVGVTSPVAGPPSARAETPLSTSKVKDAVKIFEEVAALEESRSTTLKKKTVKKSKLVSEVIQET